MINLLILCQYYPPENKIGAIRPSRFANYLMKTEKYKITVITAMPRGADCPEHEITKDGIEIFRVSTGKISSLMHFKAAKKPTSGNAEVKNTKQSKTVKQSIISVLFRLRLILEKNSLLSNAKKLLEGRQEKYDVVFSTYNTEFGHNIAGWYKKKHKNTKWIADFRDSVWLTTSTPSQIKKAKAFAKKTATYCDVITAVSKGILKTHADDFKNRKAVILYNGYDSSDIPKIEYKNDGILRLTYTGELYLGQRDLTPVFKALYKLSDEEKVDLSKIQIIYAGKSGATFKQQIKPFEKLQYINKGFVSREEALRLQLESDILLLSSWCYKGDKDTLTGKFFEYLGMKKTILCVISGEEQGCILKEMITQHHLGFCCEEAGGNTEFDMMCNFLERLYNTYESTGRIEFIPDKNFVESFEYKNITENLDDMIYQVINNQFGSF